MELAHAGTLEPSIEAVRTGRTRPTEIKAAAVAGARKKLMALGAVMRPPRGPKRELSSAPEPETNLAMDFSDLPFPPPPARFEFEGLMAPSAGDRRQCGRCRALRTADINPGRMTRGVSPPAGFFAHSPVL
jgi:hypothetical protein